MRDHDIVIGGGGLTGLILAQTLAEKHDFLLQEAIDGMDSRLKSRPRPGAKRALALIGPGPSPVASMLEPLL